jgi:hypothetical protein
VYSLSACLSSGIVFCFKNQFFFIFCFPYFSATGVVTLVFTSIFYAFSSYFLLFYAVFLLLYPVTFLLSSLILFVPMFSSSTYYRIFLRICYSSVFFIWLASGVLCFTLNVIDWLIALVQTTSSRVIRFSFDFSAELWLTTFLFILGLLLLLAVLISVFAYLVFLDTRCRYVFWLRLFYCAIVILFLIIFLTDPLLHLIVFVLCALLAESLLLTRFLQISYYGRVA